MTQFSPSTLGSIFAYNARHFPDAVAVRFEGRDVSHRSLLDRARRLASALEGAGLGHQDRVAILSRNRMEFMELYAACWTSGLVIATINFRLAGPEVAHIVNDSAPRVLFFEAHFLPLVDAIRERLTSVERFVCIDEEVGWADAYSSFVATGSSDGASYTVQPEDVAGLIYTSGTTGQPKGCVLGQTEMVRLAHTLALVQTTPIHDRFLAVMPLFHIGGLAVALGHLSRNGAVHILREFDAGAVLTEIEREKIGIVLLAPTMVQMLLDHPDASAADLSSLHTLIYSASPMPSNTLKQGVARLGPVFVQYYGQTEVISTYLPKELHISDGTDEDQARLLSAGIPFADTMVRVVDDAGDDLPVGETGEIVALTPAMARGYWDPQALRPVPFEGGYCRTGDIGRFDERGFLYIVDRKKDVIISGGENIYSREVEEALLQHPAVAEAAVIGRPDPIWGEAVCALVRRHADAEVSEADLIAHVKTRIASYKKPKSVVFLDGFPKLVSGKTDKVALRRMVAGL